jgi:hypothetical protein
MMEMMEMMEMMGMMEIASLLATHSLIKSSVRRRETKGFFRFI